MLSTAHHRISSKEASRSIILRILENQSRLIYLCVMNQTSTLRLSNYTKAEHPFLGYFASFLSGWATTAGALLGSDEKYL